MEAVRRCRVRRRQGQVRGREVEKEVGMQEQEEEGD